jgi:hypothetical protein
MAQAVALATDAGQTGDIVLLSPACASLDMYSHYVARAQAFVDAVEVNLIALRKSSTIALKTRFGENPTFPKKTFGHPLTYLHQLVPAELKERSIASVFFTFSASANVSVAAETAGLQ